MEGLCDAMVVTQCHFYQSEVYKDSVPYVDPLCFSSDNHLKYPIRVSQGQAHALNSHNIATTDKVFS